MTEDLAEWLLARIAEDEAVARGFMGTAYSRWHFEPDPDPGRAGGRVVGLGQRVEVANDWSSPYNPAAYIGVSDHIARWDPARVLAECEAKRQIIEKLGPPHFVTGGSGAAYRDVLRFLAEPYADCPGYREEWRP